MFTQLDAIEGRFNEVADELTKPEVLSDMQRTRQLSKEYKDLNVIVKAWHHYKKQAALLENARQMLETEKDPEMREMAKEEIDALEPQLQQAEDELKALLDSKENLEEGAAGLRGSENP